MRIIFWNQIKNDSVICRTLLTEREELREALLLYVNLRQFYAMIMFQIKMTELLFHFMSSVEPLLKSIMIHSPNGFNFDGLDGPDDLRRRFVAVRRSMNAEVRSLDAMVNFKHTIAPATKK